MKPDETLDGVTHVFFDVGGTILHPDPGAPEIFRRVLAKRGHRLDIPAILRLVRNPESLVHLIRPLARERQTEYYRHINARVLEHLGVESDAAILDDIRDAFEEVVWHPYPDAVATLRGLRTAGFRLGVVSNADDRLPIVLQRCGVAEYFDTVTVSVEAGAEKPDPRIFRRAVARAGAVPERALHVGDSYEADYLGARQAGLHAVVVQRSGEPPGPCPHIRSLDGLLGLLERPRSPP